MINFKDNRKNSGKKLLNDYSLKLSVNSVKDFHDIKINPFFTINTRNNYHKISSKSKKKFPSEISIHNITKNNKGVYTIKRANSFINPNNISSQKEIETERKIKEIFE